MMRTLVATLVYRLRERLRMPMLWAMVGMALLPVLVFWAGVIAAPQHARPGVVVFATAELRDAFERDRRRVPTSLVVPPEGVPYLWVGPQAYETLEIELHGSAADVAPYHFYVGNWLLDQRVDAVLGPPPTIDLGVKTRPEANRLDADELAALAKPVPSSLPPRDLIRPVIGWGLAIPGLMVGFIVAARLRTNVFLELGVGHRWGASSGEVMLGLLDAGVFTWAFAAATPEGFWTSLWVLPATLGFSTLFPRTGFAATLLVVPLMAFQVPFPMLSGIAAIALAIPAIGLLLTATNPFEVRARWFGSRGPGARRITGR